MIQTPLCDLLGIKTAIVQAPIGSASTPALAAAVSNAGGLGTLALSWIPDGHVEDVVQEAASLTQRPFGVNLVLAWPQHDRLQRCLEAGVRVVSTSWGDPSPYVDDIHAAGALHVHMVGSARDAVAAVAAGADAIVAQGWEAGGHVIGEVTTMALVPAIVDAIDPVPVVAAGGIADGRGIMAALALGASGVWLGTRFLLAEEALVHDRYRQSLIESREDDTVHSRLFNIGWDAPHRTLKNSTTIRWEEAGRPETGHRPGEGEIIASRPGQDVVRYEDALPLPDLLGEVEALPMYAGQSVGLVDAIVPARDIIQTLHMEAEGVRDKLSSR
jgi:NAD(P)H-dependent flavin oxidoreductase YrpB (nitropropane dioxygenase family)